MSSPSLKKRASGYLFAARRIERRLAANFRLNRFASSATGSFLENISKLLQILAIVVGAGWVLKEYREFTDLNHQLVNQQLQTAQKTAELTQSSLDLSNKLNQLRLVQTGQGRLEITSESSAVQARKFDDGTYLYRYQASILAKNVSDGAVTIPAMVIEFFVGTMPTEADIQAGKGFLVNQPSSWLDARNVMITATGGVEWKRIGVFAQQIPGITDEFAKVIRQFPLMSGGFVGNIGLGEAHHWNTDFVLRARPEDLAGSVITFWTIDQNEEVRRFTHTRTELLSEAQSTVQSERPSAIQQLPGSTSIDKVK
jgi:hypothetical protein